PGISPGHDRRGVTSGATAATAPSRSPPRGAPPPDAPRRTAHSRPTPSRPARRSCTAGWRRREDLPPLDDPALRVAMAHRAASDVAASLVPPPAVAASRVAAHRVAPPWMAAAG